jgi:hypothetical protein
MEGHAPARPFYIIVYSGFYAAAFLNDADCCQPGVDQPRPSRTDAADFYLFC